MLLPSIPVPLSLGLIAAFLCFFSAGSSLGLYLGGLATLAILLPPLVASEPDRLHALVAAASVTSAIAIGWLFAIFGPNASSVAWLKGCVVLAGFAMFLVGTTWFLVRFTRPLAAIAITCSIAMIWLAWPIWLSPSLGGAGGERVAAWLTWLHPPMAINTAFRHLGVWVQTPFMYAHCALGQDVPFELPRSVLPCAAIHALVGIILLAIARPRKIIEPLPELPLEWSPEEAAA